MIERFSSFINELNRAVGRLVSWLTLLLVLITVGDVCLRYFFKAGSIKLQELEWHLFALIFLLGAGYTFLENEHVRVDIFYSKFTPRVRALVNFISILIFLIPFCILGIWTSLPFVEGSYRILETSADPGGLPYRYLVKSAIPVGFFLLILQGVAELIRNGTLIIEAKKSKEMGEQS